MLVRSSKAKTVLQQAERRCLVCDWRGTVEEPETADEIGPECPVCHAPTERLAILERRVVAATADPHAAALGRKGGLKGGPARAARLSPARRREIARAAARARWRRS
jgi:hypothetical protein